MVFSDGLNEIVESGGGGGVSYDRRLQGLNRHE